MDFRVECTGVTHKELEQGREESQETIKCIAFMYIYLSACVWRNMCTCILEVGG